MSLDVTYHPFAAAEVRDVYFDGLADAHALLPRLAERFGLAAEQLQGLQTCFDEARTFPADALFNRTHGMMMAIVAGYLRPYWYLRGGAFSFLLEDAPVFADYITDWRSLTPDWVRHADSPGLAGHHSCGVFIDRDGLRRLRADHAAGGTVAHHLDTVFSDGRLDVFWKAADYAIAEGLGLIEAVDVLIPNPFDVKDVRCGSWLANCNGEGAMLYAAAARERLRQMQTMLDE